MLESPSGKEQRMKKSRFTEARSSFALRQAKSGTPVAEIIRKLGIAEQASYRRSGNLNGGRKRAGGHQG